MVKSGPGPEALIKIYARLYRAFGPQSWWPGDTPFEIIVGAILTQNTNWSNVEKAIANLKRERRLSPSALKDMPTRHLSVLIKPAGYFNVKAKRLKNFIAFLYLEYDGNIKKMGREQTGLLRKKLLGVNGIGPETADSILLYAFAKPIFVVDAYTKRFLIRHNLAEMDDDYHRLQAHFTGAIRPNVPKYNEYHALIVRLGKDYCRPNPRCAECPLNDIHYSLKYKCASCHRALPDAADRSGKIGRLLCPQCRKN